MDCVKLIQFTIYKYHIILSQPIQISNKKLTYREGYILTLTDEKNNTGFGEIAPLPGLHQESLGDCLEQLTTLKTLYLNRLITADSDSTNSISMDWLEQESWAPSVLFGVEAAILNLIARRRNLSLCKLLSDNLQTNIYLNALLYGDRENIIKRTKEALTANYRSLKLKVGRKSLEEDINLVNEVGKIIDGKATLRLDANRGWDLEQASCFAQRVSGINIEYIEEPLKETDKIPQFFKLTNIPLALDETLSYISPEIYKIPKGVKVFIIKPSLIGNIDKIKQYFSLAARNSVDVVISDTFHTGIGLAYSACLAASLIATDMPMGLDTNRWLSQDLLNKKFEAKAGYVDVIQAFENSNDINFLLLKKIVLE
jgi:O-succinylbenzoate synthase